MIEVNIPGQEPWQLAHLVLDINGTLACDGVLLSGVAKRIEALKSQLTIHLLTADTYGSAPQVAQRLGVELHVLAAGPGSPQKADFVQALGASQVAAMGNGANDAAMLRCARLGIAVLGDEGLAPDTLAAATVIVRHCHDGLDLLRYPARLLATLRL